MMGKTIWIMNHYASHMLFDKGGRHYWFAKYLECLGYKPTVFCANIQNAMTTARYFDTNVLWTEKTAEDIRTPFVFVKARPYKGNGKNRALNMFDFFHNVKKTAQDFAKKNGNPDVILASSVHPLTLVAGIQLAKRFHVKCICEVRDLWPDELICMGALSKDGIVSKGMRLLEHWIYKKADALIFTMEGAKQYIRDQNWDTEGGGNIDLQKVHYINNGVDLSTYMQNKEQFQLDDPDLADERCFKVIYTGSINPANGIDMVFRIAEKLADNEKIKFLLYGSGSELQSIQERIENDGVHNVILKGHVKKQFIPYILSKGNVSLLNYLNGDLFRYGCSNNKLFEYLAAGRPVLCTVSMNYSILKEYDCGLEVGDGDVNKMADFIRELYFDPSKAARYSANCQTAIKNFDFSVYASQLDKIIKDLT